MGLRILLFFLALLLFHQSCRKNKDKNAPVIQLDQPLNNTPVNAGALLRIRGTVTDDVKLEYVTLKIISVDGAVQLMAPISVTVENNTARFDTYAVVGDIHTVSGIYQVIVEASDGINKKKQYKEINVTEIPRAFRKAIIVKKTTVGFAVDSLASGIFHTFLTRTTDFSTAAINNYHQQFYLTGYKQGVAECVGANYFNTIWTTTAEVPPSTVPLYYFSFFNADNRVFWQSMASAISGKLKSFSTSGSVTSVFTMQPLHYPSAMLVSPTHIVVAESALTTGGSNNLNYYFKTGYALDHSATAPYSIQYIFALADNEIVVIGNDGEQGELRIYNPSTNSFWEQVNIPVGKVYGAVQTNNDEIIIAHETGLLRFVHSGTSLVNVSADKAQTLTYDAYTTTVYAGVGSVLKTYHPVTGVVLNTYTASDSIKAILLHYTK